MSILADSTELEALKVLADALRSLDLLWPLYMTREDDADATAAKNLIEGIIASNGYQINYHPGGSTELIQEPQKIEDDATS